MQAKTFLFAGALVATLVSVESQAQATRTFVSGVGNDADTCSRSAPCRTFAGAISKTATGGKINVLDPGGFGTVTITKSITISAEGVEAGILAAGANGVIINSATAVVVLRGLDIEGVNVGALAGLNGINVLSAAAVYVENCTINGFGQKGINFFPAGAASLFVKDTIIRNNNNSPNGGGIFAQGHAGALANVFLDNVLLERNFFGIKAQDFAVVQVRNSAAIGNVNNGFWAFSSGSAVEMTIESSRASHNATSGVRSENAAAILRMTDVTITNNGVLGIQAATGGQVVSFGTNKVTGNPTNGAPTATVLPI